MFAPHGSEQPPTTKGARGLCPRAFSAKRRTITERKRSFRSGLLAAADDFELRPGNDDLRRIGPGHLLGARREVQVEAAHAVPPSAHRQRENDGRAERHRAERTLVLRVRLWRERIARL